MSEIISPFELKSLRKYIGASLHGMARLLGISEDKQCETKLRAMENGLIPIPETLQRIARYMQEGQEGAGLDMVLPQYMICSDMEEDMDAEWIFHTRYPRFLGAVVFSELFHDILKENDSAQYATDDGIEYIVVAMWLDEPLDDPQAYIDRAAMLLTRYTKESIQRIENDTD